MNDISLPSPELSPDRLTVLLTGAGGNVGPELIGPFREQFNLRLLDKNPIAGEPDALCADLSDLDALTQAMQGVDVVVHLAARSTEGDFLTELVGPNITGMYNTLEAARLAHVRRIVFASTAQIVAGNPHDQKVEVTDPPRPITQYAATKVWGETLGRWFHDKHGLEFIAVRIGWYLPYKSPLLRENGGARAIWLSGRDCAQIFLRAVQTPGIGYAVVFATSKTKRERLSLDTLREVLHYEPQDDATVLYPKENQ